MAILFLVIMFSGMGFGLVLPSIMFVATNMGASAMFAGFIVSSFAMGQFFATPFWGKQSDRFGRKPILLITMFATSLTYLLMAYADRSDNLWVLLGARFLTGVTAANFAVAAAYVADITPVEKRAQGMGMVGGAVSLGFMLGPFAAGMVSGESAETASLFIPALGAAALHIVVLLAIVVFLKESLPPEKRKQKPAESVAGKRAVGSTMEILSRPLLRNLVLIGFLMFFAMTNFETIFPLWSNSRFDWGPRQVGYIFFYLAFIVMVTQMFLTGKLVPLFGEGKILLAAVVSYIFGLLSLIAVPLLFDPKNWGLILIGLTFTAAGGALFNTASTTWVSRQAGDQERGTVLGLFQSAGWLGRSIGPSVSGLLFMTLGPEAPLAAAASFLLPVFIIIIVVRHRHAEEPSG